MAQYSGQVTVRDGTRQVAAASKQHGGRWGTGSSDILNYYVLGRSGARCRSFLIKR